MKTKYLFTPVFLVPDFTKSYEFLKGKEKWKRNRKR
jgi:hypothetical protein